MQRGRKQSAVVAAAAFVTTVAVLYVAKPVLMPLAMAALLSVVLTPPVKRVERIGVGRVASVILVALLVSGGVAAVGWVVVNQVGQLASVLPDYRDNVRGKLRALHESLRSVERAARHVQELEQDLAAATPQGEQGEMPPVKVVEEPRRPIDIVRGYIGPIAAPVGTIGLVIVMVVFILIQREDLRDRLIRLLGSRDLMLTTSAMDDVSNRVSSYLRAYSLLNLGHGVVVAIGLWFIGLPAVVLFGLISAMLRFIPYVGPWVAALLPVALSIAVFPGWSRTLMVMGYLAAVELVSNNVFEPLLYGKSVGLSPFAVIIAAVFWAWIWGPVGLVLAIPLTVCLVVLGRYVPQLRFAVVLLSDEPALAPPVRLFQRLLAQDAHEADDLVEDECAEHGVEKVADTLLLPALALVDYERKLGRLDEEQIEAARQTFDVLLSTVEQCAANGGDGVAPPSPAGAGSVMCLPVSAFGDEIVCELLARVLRRRGFEVETTARLLTGEMTQRIAAADPTLVLLSALPPTGERTTRYVCRRLLAATSGRPIVICMWGAEDEAAELRKQMENQPVRVLTTFADACRMVDEALRAPAPVPTRVREKKTLAASARPRG